MPANVFDNFYQQLNKNDRAAVLNRFYALQVKDSASVRVDLKRLKKLLYDSVYGDKGFGHARPGQAKQT